MRTLVPLLVIACATACAAKSNAPPPAAPSAPPTATTTEPEPSAPEPSEPEPSEPEPSEPEGEGEVAVIVIDDVGPAPMVMAPPQRPELGSMIADILTGPRPH